MSTARRRTRQRAAVEDLLTGIDEFRTAQQIHALLQASGERVGLTTVYRSLALMAQAGQVDVLLAEDGEARYRACSSGHHHHLVCRGVVRPWRSPQPRSNGGPARSPNRTVSPTCRTPSRSRACVRHARCDVWGRSRNLVAAKVARAPYSQAYA